MKRYVDSGNCIITGQNLPAECIAFDPAAKIYNKAGDSVFCMTFGTDVSYYDVSCIDADTH